LIVSNVIPHISQVYLDEEVDVDIKLTIQLTSHHYKRSTLASSTLILFPSSIRNNLSLDIYCLETIP